MKAYRSLLVHTFLTSVILAGCVDPRPNTSASRGAVSCDPTLQCDPDGTADDGSCPCALVAAATVSAPTMNPGNNNNWNPPGFSTASLVRISTGTGAPFLTGMSGGVDGRIVTLAMAAIGDPLVLTKLDASSSPANQMLFALPLGAVALQMSAVDQSATFIYDGVVSKWRLIGKNF